MEESNSSWRFNAARQKMLQLQRMSALDTTNTSNPRHFVEDRPFRHQGHDVHHASANRNRYGASTMEMGTGRYEPISSNARHFGEQHTRAHAYNNDAPRNHPYIGETRYAANSINQSPERFVPVAKFAHPRHFIEDQSDRAHDYNIAVGASNNQCQERYEANESYGNPRYFIEDRASRAHSFNNEALVHQPRPNQSRHAAPSKYHEQERYNTTEKTVNPRHSLINQPCSSKYRYNAASRTQNPDRTQKYDSTTKTVNPRREDVHSRNHPHNNDSRGPERYKRPLQTEKPRRIMEDRPTSANVYKNGSLKHHRSNSNTRQSSPKQIELPTKDQNWVQGNQLKNSTEQINTPDEEEDVAPIAPNWASITEPAALENESVSTRQTNCNFAIWNQSHSRGRINNEHHKAFEKIWYAALKRSKLSPTDIEFQGFVTRVFRIDLASVKFVDALKEVVSKLPEVWPGSNLKLVTWNEVTVKGKLEKASVVFRNDRGYLTTKNILKIVAKQNAGLRTSDWVVISRKDMGRGILFFLGIDKGSAEIIKKTNGCISFFKNKVKMQFKVRAHNLPPALGQAGAADDPFKNELSSVEKRHYMRLLGEGVKPEDAQKQISGPVWPPALGEPGAADDPFKIKLTNRGKALYRRLLRNGVNVDEAQKQIRENVIKMIHEDTNPDLASEDQVIKSSCDGI